MIPQKYVRTLDTQFLKDALNLPVYRGRRLSDFDGRMFYKLQELVRATALGVRHGLMKDLQYLREYINHRANMGASECFASQERICADLGYGCPKTVRWMLRTLVWAKHIIKIHNSKYGTNQYIPNPNLDEWQDITPQLIAKAKEFRLVSRNGQEVKEEEEELGYFSESSDRENFLTNIPKNIYIEEQTETYQLDTNKENLNNPSLGENTTLDATCSPESGLVEEVIEEYPTYQVIPSKPTSGMVNVPIKNEGYSILQGIAFELGLNTVQEAIKALVIKYDEQKKAAKTDKQEKEVKQQSPLSEVATLDATQPTEAIEEEVEQDNAPVVVVPEKKKYTEYQLIQQEAKIKKYLSDLQKEFDIPAIDNQITQERQRIERLPDDLLMSYPIPNPGFEEGFKGIIEGHKVKDKRKSLCKEFFEWLNECKSIEECYAVLSAICDALTRNDCEIMSYIPF